MLHWSESSKQTAAYPNTRISCLWRRVPAARRDLSYIYFSAKSGRGEGPNPYQSMWDLWWIKWQSDTFLCQYVCFTLSVTFHQCSILVPFQDSSLTEGQAGEAWELSNRMMYLNIVPVFKGLAWQPITSSTRIGSSNKILLHIWKNLDCKFIVYISINFFISQCSSIPINTAS